MKTHLLTIIILFLATAAFSQRFEVENFYHDGADLSAQRFERSDVNGYKCAIIKVRSNVEGLQFDSNVGITAIEPKDDAVWLYVSTGERAIRSIDVKVQAFSSLTSTRISGKSRCKSAFIPFAL